MRVLLVEDERKISAYVKRGFEEESYAVDAAARGDADAGCFCAHPGYVATSLPQCDHRILRHILFC
jgi:DNA-binding response OmpR family regulator